MATVQFPQPPWKEARYIQPPIEEYSGNPLIEALPPIYSQEDVVSVLHIRPIINSAELQLPPHIRTHCIGRLRDWIEIRPIYLTVEPIISMMLRQGYLARNPLHPTTMRMLYALGQRDPSELCSRVRQSNLAGAFLLEGLSGVGKSTMLETLLALYPQVIEHQRYKESPFLQKQITYLIVPCPSDASPRALCLEFFKAVDNVLGTDYYNQYLKSRHATDVLLIDMALVAATFHIGMLVIDEVQNLKASRSARQNLGNSGYKTARPKLGQKAQELMNFFVKLINWVGIPTIFVGTGDVAPLFDETMQYVRRATANGHIIVEPIQRDSDEWNNFVAKLWKYQWLQSPLPFNPSACSIPGSRELAISAHCHYLSCGLPDVLVKLFMQAQWLALRSGRETLHVELLDETYDAVFGALQPSLESLRAGRDGAKEDYESRYPNSAELEGLSIPPVCMSIDEPLMNTGTKTEAVEEPTNTSTKIRNAPIIDLQTQFKITSSSVDNNLHELDLRSISNDANKIQNLRKSGIVLEIARIL